MGSVAAPAVEADTSCTVAANKGEASAAKAPEKIRVRFRKWVVEFNFYTPSWLCRSGV